MSFSRRGLDRSGFPRFRTTARQNLGSGVEGLLFGVKPARGCDGLAASRSQCFVATETSVPMPDCQILRCYNPDRPRLQANSCGCFKESLYRRTANSNQMSDPHRAVWLWITACKERLWVID